MVYVVDGTAHPGHKPQGDEYQREPTKFAHDGSALDVASSDLHLYVCAACPWAHRALITRNLSATLRSAITVSVVSPFRNDDIGWEFLREENRETVEGFTKLPVTRDNSPLGASSLLEVYLKGCPNYTGNVTTPVLYDARANRIVSNDSFGIMRTFVATASDIAGLAGGDFQHAVDSEGRTMDAELGKRVYMCGLAKTQEAYESSVVHVFDELERLERRLTESRRLVGENLTLADIQAVACLVRFDPVYFDLFKCFKRRIVSYPKLSAYLREVTEEIGIEALALDLDQIVHHYYTNFTSANPNGVVPIAYRDDFLDGGRAKFPDDGGAPIGSGDSTQQDQSDTVAKKARGEFVRGVAAHRNWLGDEDFPVEADRYVLFVANNCPWCHRTMMARAMYPGMEELIEVSVLFYRRGGPEERWRFLPNSDELKCFERARPELLEGVDRQDKTGNGIEYAPEVYKLSDPTSNQTSVPILFDKKTKRVVSNESADIVRMLAMLSGYLDDSLLTKIDSMNARIYQDINNGAYRAGFTSNQGAHEAAVEKYFRGLAWLDSLLADSKYLLTKDVPSEVDLRLFPTIYRHDPVYHARMKLNIAMIRDYPNLNRWLLDMKCLPAVKRASRIDHCVAGYFGRTGNALCPFDGLCHDGVQPY